MLQPINFGLWRRPAQSDVFSTLLTLHCSILHCLSRSELFSGSITTVHRPATSRLFMISPHSSSLRTGQHQHTMF